MAGWHRENYHHAKAILKANDFKDESHFCDLIEYNFELVSEAIFSEKYISHIREYKMPNKSMSNKMLAIDFLLTTEKGITAIECKHPKGRTQSGIYQLMKYQLIAEDNNIHIDRYVLFTTEYSHYDQAIINRYNLPFSVFMISREKVFSYGTA